MNIYNVLFSELQDDYFLRFDTNNIHMRRSLNRIDSTCLSEYLIFMETGKPIEPNDYVDDSENIHLVVRNITNGQLSYNNVIHINDDKAEELANYRLSAGDIVIAISGNCGASFYYNTDSKYNITLSHYLCRVRVDESRLLPDFFVYYLNSPVGKCYFRGTETGKTQKNLSKYYIKNFPIHVPTVEKQKEFCLTIKPYEEKIQALKDTLCASQRIIDKVFNKTFQVSDNIRNIMHKGMTYGTQASLNTKIQVFKSTLCNLTISNGLRGSARSQNRIYADILSKVIEKDHIKLKDICISINNGKKPYYVKDGDVLVVKTANVTNDGLVFDAPEFVSEEQYNTDTRAQIKQGDILVCNIGKCSLGKVDLCETEEKLFAATETMILRVNPKLYNPTFLLFYLRSVFGTAQFEKEYTGTTNQIHISPENVGDFLIPVLSLNEQQDVVNDIQEQISEQEKIKGKIATLREEIDNIILQTING